MELRQASDADNDQLLKYFASHSVPGPITLRQRRMFNFFNQYSMQSDDWVTFLLQDKAAENPEIEAMASIVFRQAVVEGNRETIGYATDLRVSPTRRAITSWAQHFLPVLENARLERQAKYIFTVVAHSQRQAYNAFIRPRSVRRGLPRYHLFRRFNIVSLHGLWPFHEDPLPGIRVRTAAESDWDKLADYLVAKSTDKPLYYYWDREQARLGLERWRDLYVENFLIALDRNENIIGCVAPWTGERVQRTYAQKYGPKAQNLHDMLRVLSWFRIAHPLPPEGQELEIRYLTHLHAENPDIFYSLLFHAYKQSGRREVLVYPSFEGDLLTLPPRSFIAAEMRYGLYCILSPNDPIPDFLKPKAFHKPPLIEPAWL